jgi:CheY-like chemotaxis protein
VAEGRRHRARHRRAPIESLGWQPVAAEDGAQALRALQAEPGLELAVLDWMMPEIDGIEVARRVRAAPEARSL